MVKLTPCISRTSAGSSQCSASSDTLSEEGPHHLENDSETSSLTSPRTGEMAVLLKKALENMTNFDEFFVNFRSIFLKFA